MDNYITAVKLKKFSIVEKKKISNMAKRVKFADDMKIELLHIVKEQK